MVPLRICSSRHTFRRKLRLVRTHVQKHAPWQLPPPTSEHGTLLASARNLNMSARCTGRPARSCARGTIGLPRLARTAADCAAHASTISSSRSWPKGPPKWSLTMRAMACGTMMSTSSRTNRFGTRCHGSALSTPCGGQAVVRGGSSMRPATCSNQDVRMHTAGTQCQPSRMRLPPGQNGELQ